MIIVKYVIVVILSYLIGSISIAIIVSTGILKKDVRTEGSGNAGATNVARVFGMSMGLITLVGDCLKTIIAMLIGRWLLGANGEAVAAVVCMLGHCFPVYYGFKGGKGVAVGAAVGLMTDLRLFLVLVVVFLIAFALTQRVSAGSIAAAVSFPIAQLIFGIGGMTLVMGICVAVIICFMHRGNFVRLIHGTEPKFVPKKTK